MWQRCLLSVIAFVCWTPHATASVSSNPAKRLSVIKSNINHIQQAILQQQQQRDRLQHDLKHIELSTSQLQHELQKTQQQMQQQRQLLTAVQQNERHYQSQLQRQQHQLANQVQIGYRLIHQPTLKLWLNQNDTNQLQRILMYYQYLSQNNIATLNQCQRMISQLEQSRQTAQQHVQTLARLQQQQASQQQQLAKLHQTRQQLISELDQSLANKQQRLTHLQHDRRRLSMTLRRLAQRHFYYQMTHHNFDQLRGKLTWPTKGRLLAYFGTKIQQSELRWGGDVIQAPDGAPVVAIAPGKVVYADWLSGYGLLLIVYHGHGYMTLYGRNHELFKQVGDTVSPGDVIATVGNSGGFKAPGLYFAIRHNAQPLDPTIWCR